MKFQHVATLDDIQVPIHFQTVPSARVFANNEDEAGNVARNGEFVKRTRVMCAVRAQSPSIILTRG